MPIWQSRQDEGREDERAVTGLRLQGGGGRDNSGNDGGRDRTATLSDCQHIFVVPFRVGPLPAGRPAGMCWRR